jgi:two-component system NtrC family sensor kinase
VSLSAADARVARLLALDDALRTEQRPYHQLLQRIAEAAREIVGCDGTSVALREGESLVFRASAGRVTPLDEARPITTMDGPGDPRADPVVLQRFGMGSAILVPLFGNQGVAGVLSATWEATHAFGDAEVDAVRLLAQLVGSQVARAEAESTRAALIDREQVLAAVFDESPLSVAVIQAEGNDYRYLSINRAGAASFGKRVDELVGRLASALGVGPETLAWWSRKFEEAGARGAPLRVEFTSDIRPSIYSTVICALPPAPGQPIRFCCISEDTSERLQLREQLATADRRAAVGHLAAGVAHELNNPLSFVRSNLAFVTEELTAQGQSLPAPLRQELSEALSEASDGVHRMQRIVTSLLTYARSAPAELQTIRLEAVARSTAQMARGNVQVTADLIEELGETPAVAVDGVRLGQVVLNLVLNAAQALRPDGKRHQVKLVTRLGPQGETVLEVSDTGAGISPASRARLFEPFFTTKPPGQGTGLGLSICKNIVESAGGTITVESTPGEGTIFQVTLPPAGSGPDGGSSLG